MIDETAVRGLVERFARLRREAAELSDARPNNADAQTSAAAAFSSAGAHEAAYACFLRAQQLVPYDADRVYNVGVAAQHLGRLEEAEACYQRASLLAPGSAKVLHSLVQLKKQTADANSIEPLERLFLHPGIDEISRLFAGHALAKSYDDLDKCSIAFSWLEKAKAERRRARSYSVDAEEQLVLQAFALIDAIGDGCDSEEPIFIVGMPRTGTSLVDRIITNHTQVTAVGELNNFAQLMTAFAGTKAGFALHEITLAAAMRCDLARLGRAYVDSTRPISGDTFRFVDKMPLNYMLVGLIARALPRARIICVIRGAMDATLSLYKRFFATEHLYYDYAYDIANTARAYTLFLRVARHWSETLSPQNFTIVHYEDIVADLEGQSRRLIAFCGLPWEEACLRFHENKSAITTPSAVQVRQPLHDKAVGRWRAYGSDLDPARAVFEAAGVPLD